jgi:hypothetical protein
VLLSIYAKNVKVNLSQSECSELRTLVPVLVAQLLRRRTK